MEPAVELPKLPQASDSSNSESDKEGIKNLSFEGLRNKSTSTVVMPLQSGFHHTLKVLPIKKRRIRVLSLCDGISPGLLVLKTKLGLDIDTYFSSEIDKKYLCLQAKNWGNAVVRLGDMKEFDEAMLGTLGPIDLVIGGSPSYELTLVNWRGRGVDDPDSTGHLFYNFKRIKDYYQERMAQAGLPFFWLYVNSGIMRQCNLTKITDQLGGREPVLLNASDYVPLSWRRNFWGNIPHMNNTRQSPSEVEPRQLSDSLKRKINATTLATLRTRKTKNTAVRPVPKECSTWCEEHKLVFRPCDRINMLAKTWCIPVVEDILRPLSEIFITDQESRV